MSGPPPLHQAIAVLDAGGQVRVARSRGYAMGLLVLGLLVGAGLLAWLVFAVADGLRRDRMGVVLAHPVTWASTIAVVACALLPVVIAVRLHRREALVVTHGGLATESGGVIRSHVPWTGIERVGFERVTGPYYHFAPRSVTYVLTPAAVEARDRALVAAGRRPPRYGLLGPGGYVLEAGYVGGRRRLYELLAAAHHRYGGVRPS